MIHLGVALLMIGELVVSLVAVEERMFIREGETSSVASESAVLELAVIDRSPEDHDQIVSIPISRLRSGKSFQHHAIPFDIELIQSIKNAKLVPIENQKDKDDTSSLATAGVGRKYLATSIAAVSPSSDGLTKPPPTYGSHRNQ